MCEDSETRRKWSSKSAVIHKASMGRRKTVKAPGLASGTHLLASCKLSLAKCMASM